MNISYNWLGELIDIYLPPEELALELTRVGLAVEGLHPSGGDTIFDIDLTSNRPDCLSHLGVAREVAVITGARMKQNFGLPLPSDVPFPRVLAGEVVTVENPELCYRFTARVIRNVNIGPSPKWLVERLEAVGERSINSVADITNFVMLELGQPMHAFDLDKLVENRIVVRTARTGERITTLDEQERELDNSMLMICDAEQPVAVGGIMGGLASAITNETRNVLLEVAYFDRSSIRRTSRKLNLTSEASYRFERGVDINNLWTASNRATKLISEVAGGDAEDFIDVYPTPVDPREVRSPDIAADVRRLTGLNVDEAEAQRILAALGIVETEPSQRKESRLKMFSVPSWRHDIAIEEDLVEEVARHLGYENIDDRLPPAFGAGEYQSSESRKRNLRSALAYSGFDEAIGYSFIDERHDGLFSTVPGLIAEDLKSPYITLQDSVIEGSIRMRPTLLPGLLEAIRLNMNHRRRDIKLFEIGKVFSALGGGKLPVERELLAIAITGGELHEGRALPVRQSDLYDLTGSLAKALDAIGFSCVQFEACGTKHLTSGQSAAVLCGGQNIGFVGRLNKEIAADYKFRQPVYVAEIDLQQLMEHPIEPIRYRPLPRFPTIVRDVSFAVSRDVTFATLRTACLDQRVELCRSVNFVDVFEGKGLAEDERSITIRIEYQSDERTLTEVEIEPIHRDIVRSVEDKLKIKQRI